MTIQQAIKYLTGLTRGIDKNELPNLHAAANLGIEALKTIKAERTIYGFKRQARLPGETDEKKS
jgi:hypothetical protein